MREHACSVGGGIFISYTVSQSAASSVEELTSNRSVRRQVPRLLKEPIVTLLRSSALPWTALAITIVLLRPRKRGALHAGAPLADGLLHSALLELP